VFCHSEAAYEEVRQRQRELRERSQRSQLIARTRREATLAGSREPRRRNWFARLTRADLARP
jgi:hypothetical protein